MKTKKWTKKDLCRMLGSNGITAFWYRGMLPTGVYSNAWGGETFSRDGNRERRRLKKCPSHPGEAFDASF